MVFRKLAGLAVDHPEEAPAVAGGVEELSCVITPKEDEGRALEALACQLAASPNDAVRRHMLYYAGSPTRRDKPPVGEIDRRERILEVLVKHETGGCLTQLLWKLGESAHERPDALGHAIDLVQRFGRDDVLAAAAVYAVLPPIKRFCDELEHRLDP